MKLSFLAIFAFLAPVAARVKKRPADDEAKLGSWHWEKCPAAAETHRNHVYEHLALEGVDIQVFSDDDDEDFMHLDLEEIEFMNDCLLYSFDQINKDANTQGIFAALTGVEPGDDGNRALQSESDESEEGRALWNRHSSFLNFKMSFGCRWCYDDMDDPDVKDDPNWNRNLGENNGKLARTLRKSGLTWEAAFCRLLQLGPYKRLNAITECGFKVSQLRPTRALISV